MPKVNKVLEQQSVAVKMPEIKAELSDFINEEVETAKVSDTGFRTLEYGSDERQKTPFGAFHPTLLRR